MSRWQHSHFVHFFVCVSFLLIKMNTTDWVAYKEWRFTWTMIQKIEKLKTAWICLVKSFLLNETHCRVPENHTVRQKALAEAQYQKATFLVSFKFNYFLKTPLPNTIAGWDFCPLSNLNKGLILKGNLDLFDHLFLLITFWVMHCQTPHYTILLQQVLMVFSQLNYWYTTLNLKKICFKLCHSRSLLFTPTCRTQNLWV